jgi:LPS export ABC transporter protein LptC
MDKKTLLKHIISGIAILLVGMAMLISCKPDIKAVEAISMEENKPLETAENIKIYYSTYGRLQMILEAPSMSRYVGDNPYMELTDGFLMVFYDSLNNESSRISARYAIQYERTKMIEARNDVVVENINNQEKMNTEELIWDQNRQLIFTDKFVKITTQEEVLYGDGFESDEGFTSWHIKNPKGTFYLETEEMQPGQAEPEN